MVSDKILQILTINSNLAALAAECIINYKKHVKNMTDYKYLKKIVRQISNSEVTELWEQYRSSIYQYAYYLTNEKNKNKVGGDNGN